MGVRLSQKQKAARVSQRQSVRVCLGRGGVGGGRAGRRKTPQEASAEPRTRAPGCRGRPAWLPGGLPIRTCMSVRARTHPVLFGLDGLGPSGQARSCLGGGEPGEKGHLEAGKT